MGNHPINDGPGGYARRLRRSVWGAEHRSCKTSVRARPSLTATCHVILWCWPLSTRCWELETQQAPSDVAC